MIGVSRETDGEGHEAIDVEDIEGVLGVADRDPISSLVDDECGRTGVFDGGLLTILIVVTACLYK